MAWNNDSRAAAGKKQPLVAKRYVPRGSRVLAKPRRCPAGHLVKVWPCIECAIVAEARLAVMDAGGMSL